MNCTADQRLCFRYEDSTIPLLESLAFLCDCTGRFVSEMVGIPHCWFPHAAAHLILRARYRSYNTPKAVASRMNMSQRLGTEPPYSVHYRIFVGENVSCSRKQFGVPCGNRTQYLSIGCPKHFHQATALDHKPSSVVMSSLATK